MRLLAPVVLNVLLTLVSAGVFAGDITASVRDQDGQPVADAVITVSGAAASKTAPAGTTAIIDQIDKEYVPHVIAVQAGTDVSFPNKDDIRHHVYSFSEPKTFELPLYEGTPAKPVRFDKPGVVVLGCNIHDWMRGYIYITDTPYFAKSATEGRAIIRNLPAGSYTVTVWHPRMKNGGAGTQRSVAVDASGNASVAFDLDLKPEIRIRRAPTARRRSRY
jgi:plastocyanin